MNSRIDPLIIIAGPTACGKTSTAIELAKQINGSIISADSMQVYKYMDIGTAKPNKEELSAVKHYLIDELYPDEEFSVAVFQKMAQKAIKEIVSKGKIPILCGGTGFYINALIKNTDFTDEKEKNQEYRFKMTALAKEKGAEFIHAMLKDIDYPSYKNIHPNNVKRVIRALEFYNETGTKISEHNDEEKRKPNAYNVHMFVLNRNRERLYKNIDRRVDFMLNDGLINEVKNLLDMGYNRNLVSMQGLGYKEIVPYLLSECSLEHSVEILKRDTRHFAKRQLTWFKHQSQGEWLDMDNFTSAIEAARHIKGIIDKRILHESNGDTNDKE